MSWSQFWEIVKDGKACMLQSVGLQRVGLNLATEQQTTNRCTAGHSEAFKTLLGSSCALMMVLTCCVLGASYQVFKSSVKSFYGIAIIFLAFT